MNRTRFPDKHRSSLREKARQAAEQKEGTESWWLNNNTTFDHSFSLSENLHIVAKTLFNALAIDGYKVEQKYRDFEILLANLLYQRRKPVSISRNINDWGKSRYRNTSYFMVELLKIAKENGLIEMSKWYYDPRGKRSRMTRIWPTSLLLDYFPLIPNGITYKPVEFVLLRDEKHQLIEYKDTAETIRIRKILQEANRVNQAATIIYGEDHLSGFLHAIFSRKFTLYGRLHTRGFRHYQGMSEKERGEITINGDQVVELDFSGLHPRLLYAKERIQYNDDPYTEVDSNANSRGVVRDFLKSILLFMLNAKDETTAEAAANYWLYNEHDKRRRLKKQEITKARPFIEAFKKAHEPIAHHFSNGKDTGLRTMNLDSKIALDVVKHFTAQGKPILAVHDSFIVQRQFRDQLFKVMDETYKKYTGGFTCPIK